MVGRGLIHGGRQQHLSGSVQNRAQYLGSNLLSAHSCRPVQCSGRAPQRPRTRLPGLISTLRWIIVLNVEQVEKTPIAQSMPMQLQVLARPRVHRNTVLGKTQ